MISYDSLGVRKTGESLGSQFVEFFLEEIDFLLVGLHLVEHASLACDVLHAFAVVAGLVVFSEFDLVELAHLLLDHVQFVLEFVSFVLVFLDFLEEFLNFLPLRPKLFGHLFIVLFHLHLEHLAFLLLNDLVDVFALLLGSLHVDIVELVLEVLSDFEHLQRFSETLEHVGLVAVALFLYQEEFGLVLTALLVDEVEFDCFPLGLDFLVQPEYAFLENKFGVAVVEGVVLSADFNLALVELNDDLQFGGFSVFEGLQLEKSVVDVLLLFVNLFPAFLLDALAFFTHLLFECVVLLDSAHDLLFLEIGFQTPLGILVHFVGELEGFEVVEVQLVEVLVLLLLVAGVVVELVGQLLQGLVSRVSPVDLLFFLASAVGCER